METIWTNGGDAINVRGMRDVPVAAMVEYAELERQGKQVEAILYLLGYLVEFKEDMEIIRGLSMKDFEKFVTDWMATNE